MDRDKDSKDNAVASLCEFQVAPLKDDNSVLARLVVQGAGNNRSTVELILDADYALVMAIDLQRAAEQVIKAREHNAATAIRH